jgi:hypothetical protein
MTNQNSKEIKCPKCGNSDRQSIERMAIIVSFEKDGSDSFSVMFQCHNCFEDFTISIEPENNYQNQNPQENPEVNE